MSAIYPASYAYNEYNKIMPELIYLFDTKLFWLIYLPAYV
jgi:hypothetical protein